MTQPPLKRKRVEDPGSEYGDASVEPQAVSLSSLGSVSGGAGSFAQTPRQTFGSGSSALALYSGARGSPSHARVLSSTASALAVSAQDPDVVEQRSEREEYEYREQELVRRLQAMQRDMAETRRQHEDEKREMEKVHRRKVAELDRKLGDATTERDRLSLQIEEQKAVVMAERAQEAGKNQSLQTKLKFLFSQEEKHKDALKARETEIHSEKFALAEEAKAARADFAAKEAKLRSELDDLRQKNSDLTLQLEAQQHKEGQDGNELELLREQLEQAQGREQQWHEDRRALNLARNELAKTNLALEKAQRELSESQHGEATNKSLREALSGHSELERKCRALNEELRTVKGQVQNSGLLKEQIAGLEAKLERARQAQEASARVETDFRLLTEKHEAWMKAIARYVPSARSPADFTAQLEEMQSDRLVQISRASDAHTASKEHQAALEDARSKLEAALKQAANSDSALALEKAAVANLQQRVGRLTKEKDGYKRILDSFSDEAASNNQDLPRIQRIQALEQAVSDRDGELSSLRKELESVQGELKQQAQQLQRAEDECATLSKRLGRGEYDPSTTKVLHMSMNPESKAKSDFKDKQIEQLRTDKSKQLERIAQLEQQLAAAAQSKHGARLSTSPSNGGVFGGAGAASAAPATRAGSGSAAALFNPWAIEGSSSASSPTPSLSASDASIGASSVFAVQAEFEEKLAKVQAEKVEAEKKHARLIEVFTAKVTEFREACYRLTGFKIQLSDKKGGEQYKLRNMFMERDTDQLVFTVASNGDLQVMETDFLKRLPQGVLDYLYERGSIPAFLANVTLELFGQQTMTFSKMGAKR